MFWVVSCTCWHYCRIVINREPFSIHTDAGNQEQLMSEHSTTREIILSLNFQTVCWPEIDGPFSSVTVRPGRSDAHARDTAINQEYETEAFCSHLKWRRQNIYI